MVKLLFFGVNLFIYVPTPSHKVLRPLRPILLELQVIAVKKVHFCHQIPIYSNNLKHYTDMGELDRARRELETSMWDCVVIFLFCSDGVGKSCWREMPNIYLQIWRFTLYYFHFVSGTARFATQFRRG